MEHSDATQTAPSITDATYTVIRELRESQGSSSGTWTHEPTDYSPRCCPKTLSHYRQWSFIVPSIAGSDKGTCSNALCSYPLKLEIKKFGKVKAQFSLNFVPNFKISVLTGKELYKIWGKNIFFEYLSKMCHLKAKNLLLVSEKPQILHRRKLCRA